MPIAEETSPPICNLQSAICNSPRNAPDEETLFRVAKQSSAGVAVMYDLYADKLYGYFLKRCSHKETAEDLVSKTFVKFMEQLPSLEWRGVPIRAWLFRVATNLLNDYWRSSSARRDVVLDEEVWEMPSPAESPAWHSEQAIERWKLLELMKTSPARDQEALDLHFFGGCSAKEMAEIMHVSPNHASVLLYRALGRLRTKYLNTYGTPTR